MEDHYADCDGLCYDCEEFSWCVCSPVNSESELNILQSKNLNNNTNN